MSTKFKKAIIKWCETDDQSELIRYTIHAYSQPNKYVKLRNSLTLEPEDVDEIRKSGLVEIRKQLAKYLDSLEKDEGGNFIIKNAIYANGICCRDCLSVCHKIKYWEKLSEENKELLVTKTTGWIQKKYEELY